ncbi:MAG TPA: YraN family protein [Candidatus Omnitrophota bacterium]|nr:YraN family protein [Candidatus Omnitrophota bacterium]
MEMTMVIESLGRWGEERAAEFLKAKGYCILERNYKNKIGEIDIVVSDGKTLVFVEVKTRRSLAYGPPYDSVTRHKQTKIARVALSYLKYRFGTVDVNARFDVISIVRDESGGARIEHIRNAFDLP